MKRWTVLFFLLSVLGGAMMAAEEPSDPTARTRTRLESTQPIRTLDDFFQRLASERGFVSEPDPAWVTETGAPALSRDALRLALAESVLEADRLVETARELQSTLAGTGSALSPSARDQVKSQLNQIQRHAQQLVADPYLKFLDMGRAGSDGGSKARSSIPAPDLTEEIRRNAEAVRFGLELFFQPDSHRVVEWHQLSSPSPRGLSLNIARLARQLEMGIGSVKGAPASFVSGK